MNLVAHAPDGVEDLNSTIREFDRQVEVTRSLLTAERVLRGDLTHNIKFNRIRPTLKFIYGQDPQDKIQQQRRESLSALDDSSRALCALAFTPHAILQLTDDTFEALMSGISVFVEKKGLAGLIESRIGHFIRRTLKDFIDDTPMPLLWVESRPLKRKKVNKGRQDALPKSGGTTLPRQHLRRKEPRAFAGAQPNTPVIHDDNFGIDSSQDSQSKPQALLSEGPLHPHSSSLARDVSPGRSPQHTDVEHVCNADHELFPSLSADNADSLCNDMRANWFGRGIALSDADILQQFEAWTHTEGDNSTLENAYELSWSDQLS